jgi:hypothetical protein
MLRIEEMWSFFLSSLSGSLKVQAEWAGRLYSWVHLDWQLFETPLWSLPGNKVNNGSHVILCLNSHHFFSSKCSHGQQSWSWTGYQTDSSDTPLSFYCFVTNYRIIFRGGR